jgi:hypothetical protein
MTCTVRDTIVNFMGKKKRAIAVMDNTAYAHVYGKATLQKSA